MLASRVRIGTYGTMSKIEIPEGYVLATDSDFSGTTNRRLKYIGTDEYIVIPNIIQGVAVTSYEEMFSDNSVIKGVASNNINVTNMSNMFEETSATELDLSNLDTSSVTDMNYMFSNSSVTELDLSNFNTSNVTTMGGMFYGSSATTLDLSNFDTSSVTYMSVMFSNSSATEINLSSFDTSNVTDMYGMFSDSKATVLDLSSFDTSSADGMYSMPSMFQNASATTGYARTQADADRLNASSGKPAGLNFVVKP